MELCGVKVSAETLKGKSIRKLATLVDLALEVAFLIEEILEPEVCLVHVLPGIRGRLFVCAGGDVGGSIEGLEACEKGASAYVECGWVCICIRRRDEVLKVFYGWIRVGHGGRQEAGRAGITASPRRFQFGYPLTGIDRIINHTSHVAFPTATHSFSPQYLHRCSVPAPGRSLPWKPAATHLKTTPSS